MQSNLNEEREKNLWYNCDEPYTCGHNYWRFVVIVGDHKEKSNSESISQEEGDEYEGEIWISVYTLGVQQHFHINVIC